VRYKGIDASELRERRLRLGYSVALMAEVLQIAPRRLEEWESGAVAIPDPHDLANSLDALLEAHHSSSPACNLVLLDGLPELERTPPSLARRAAQLPQSAEKR
jgi:transcriptional regulator with XRE-family HTH domain